MSNENKIPVIAVVGPTASGKTRLGIELAKMFNGEIVSADSMQIYKGMDILTAKPTKEEMYGIVHHLIGFLNPDQNYSVADYVENAKKVIEEIHQNGKLPIVVGGTGFYVNSLMNGITFSENSFNDDVRADLQKKLENEGIESLLSELNSFDSVAAEQLKSGNAKRIIRAIEVYKTTGITITEHNKRSVPEEKPYNDIRIGLKFQDRNILYERINNRVDIMMKSGLLEEARGAYFGSLSKTSKMAIGYKELIPYFENKCSLNECVEKIKQETRHYAKRQLTWFIRDKSIHWIDIDTVNDENEIVNLAANLVNCYFGGF
ncbi:MAG: tRNA (adenosine(37)-N6)-dimethylallyltransferase MiaA [Bacillota bacterium]|nr:tRNA (adenosine(37)-N6)-dimethylallyltransferase MiaA [Bacillota bacterium]